MITNLLVPARINVLKYFVCAACLTGMMMGCVYGGSPDEYRESRKQVTKFPIEQSDVYLRVAIFLKLRDGSLQRPKLYYYQAHQVLFGWRTVEKPGRLSSPTTKNRPFLYLPVSDNIDKYLFLIRKPIIKEVKQDGKTKKEYEWTDWFLLEVDAKDVTQEKPIVIPPFEELAKDAERHKELLEKLRSMYEKARVEAEKKMNTPIKSRSEVPWYAQ